MSTPYEMTLQNVREQLDHPDSLAADVTIANIVVTLEDDFTGRHPEEIVDYLRDLIADHLGCQYPPALETLILQLLEQREEQP